LQAAAPKGAFDFHEGETIVDFLKTKNKN